MQIMHSLRPNEAYPIAVKSMPEPIRRHLFCIKHRLQLFSLIIFMQNANQKTVDKGAGECYNS